MDNEFPMPDLSGEIKGISDMLGKSMPLPPTLARRIAIETFETDYGKIIRDIARLMDCLDRPESDVKFYMNKLLRNMIAQQMVD